MFYSLPLLYKKTNKNKTKQFLLPVPQIKKSVILNSSVSQPYLIRQKLSWLYLQKHLISAWLPHARRHLLSPGNGMSLLSGLPAWDLPVTLLLRTFPSSSEQKPKFLSCPWLFLISFLDINWLDLEHFLLPDILGKRPLFPCGHLIKEASLTDTKQ